MSCNWCESFFFIVVFLRALSIPTLLTLFASSRGEAAAARTTTVERREARADSEGATGARARAKVMVSEGEKAREGEEAMAEFLSWRGEVVLAEEVFLRFFSFFFFLFEGSHAFFFHFLLTQARRKEKQLSLSPPLSP